ncbi:MAG: hypothetical protein WAV20_25755 [Blastocatellia bacterium]
MTTLLPGVAYATALVMKVCIAEGVVTAFIASVRRERPGFASLATAAANEVNTDWTSSPSRWR